MCASLGYPYVCGWNTNSIGILVVSKRSDRPIIAKIVSKQTRWNCEDAVVSARRHVSRLRRLQTGEDCVSEITNRLVASVTVIVRFK